MLKCNQLIQRMPDGIDCGIITNDVNRTYFTGFSSSAGILLITSEKAYLLIDFRYYERALENVSGVQVLLLKDAKQQIQEIFDRHACKTIAVESNSMTLAEFSSYRSNHPNQEFLSDKRFSDLIDDLRMIKTQDEIYKILSAQAITELAFEHILDYMSEGMTEQQVAKEINRFILDRTDSLAFETIVVSGRNSSSPHGVPTNKLIEDGDFVTMDFGASLDGYKSDMTRTICVGEPSEEQLVVYKTVLFGQSMALDYIGAGKTGKKVDGLIRSYFESLDYGDEFGHSLGHGVGLEIHEKPNLSPKSNTELKEGMVVTVEPGLYLPGKFGVRIEDMVVVTKMGCRNLTKTPKELICL